MTVEDGQSDCLFNSPFRLTTKKTSVRCEGNLFTDDLVFFPHIIHQDFTTLIILHGMSILVRIELKVKICVVN